MHNRFNSLIIQPVLSAIKDHSSRNAFCINEVFYTYKQLGEYISKIREVINTFQESDIYFGLVVNDDIETYASVFALWLEGKAYIPLHPKQPKERNIEVISQMGINNILDSSIKSIYNEYYVISTKNLSYNSDFLDYSVNIDEDKPVYILFTSGSTGKPKGVQISRKNIGAFMESFWDTGIEINETDRCLQIFDMTFDVSVQSFLTPLTKGACAYTVPHDQIKYSYVYGLLEDHRITFGAMAPSMLRYLRPYFDEIDLPAMKTCIVTAEASPLKLIKEWQECIPNATIYNFYGPTEATIYCTYYKVQYKNVKTINGMISIGKPLKNVKAIVIDDNGNIVPNGIKGELCVTGDQVTPGYWNDKEKNDKAFFSYKTSNSIKRFYHTGDICHIDNDGEIMLSGRKDSQVKIQGYRVETGEIEFHARTFLKNINAIVIPFNNNSNNTELAIFIEAQKIDDKALDEYLKSKLPHYMIPTKKIFINQFPLNSSDKVDKIRLKDYLNN